ncbi:MAG: hypothetical protein KatS3mg038_0224 [Candidatus Kapaibacterium sp.]|nr:MAG: hypothetical protein KatS3mg038_0224 [Candidatus Kapabacteria bacterium]
MDVLSLFWLFVMVSSLQPIIRQRLIEAARQRLIARIEQERSSRVILIVHRQETMRLLGFPLVKYLTMEDSEDVLRALEATDDDRDIDLVLHTPGGLVIAALQIARAIQRRRGKTRVIIPHYAMSGGTLIALAADEIIMSKNAVLGPIDPQLGEFPAPSLLRLRQIKDVNEIDDRTLILADIAEKALEQMRQAVAELLAKELLPRRCPPCGRTTDDRTMDARLSDHTNDGTGDGTQRFDQDSRGISTTDEPLSSASAYAAER